MGGFGCWETLSLKNEETLRNHNDRGLSDIHRFASTSIKEVFAEQEVKVLRGAEPHGI
jgi:hypothetical protein